MKTSQEPWIAATQRDPKGLDAREIPLLRRREKCFLLTSPFIEPAKVRILLRIVYLSMFPQRTTMGM